LEKTQERMDPSVGRTKTKYRDCINLEWVTCEFEGHCKLIRAFCETGVHVYGACSGDARHTHQIRFININAMVGNLKRAQSMRVNSCNKNVVRQQHGGNTRSQLSSCSGTVLTGHRPGQVVLVEFLRHVSWRPPVTARMTKPSDWVKRWRI
jgi:hypothetical protein